MTGSRKRQICKEDKVRAEYALEQIGMLYDIERMADDKQLSYEERSQLRGRLAYPILVVFEKWIYNEIPKVLPGGRMGKALRYIYKDFHRLSRYHLDGLGCPVNELRMFRSVLKEEVRLLRFFDKLTIRSSPDAYDKYYFSYSTGNTHYLCYAIGDNPYGPFTYKGVILNPVVGWTTHHSIVEFRGKWYLFHHDSGPSGGKTWLRSMKVVELKYNPDGTIQTV